MKGLKRCMGVGVVIFLCLFICNVGEGSEVTGTVVEQSRFAERSSVALATSDGGTTVFYAPPKNYHVIKQVWKLIPGDKVSIKSNSADGINWIEEISGSGTFVGKITAKGGGWIHVGDGKQTQRFVAYGAAGFDKNIVDLLSGHKIGSRIAVTWTLEEYKRIVDVKSAE